MDTEKARIFLTVMNEGSLSGAAEKLGYTTSGISRSIAAIEAETGGALFTRSRKGVVLTPEGEAFLPVMRELVHQEEKLRETAGRLRGLETGTVTIGISYGGYLKLISEQLKNFADQFPGIRIRTLEATSTQLLQALRDHEADLAIMTERASELNFHELKRSPMAVCLPADHPAAGEKTFPLCQFETEPFIAPFPDIDTDYHRALEGAGITPNVQYTTTDIYTAYCMVEAGLGAALLNRLEIEAFHGRVAVMKTDPEIFFRIGIMHPERETMTMAARKLLETLTKGQTTIPVSMVK